MKYKNTKTGVVIDATSQLRGAWVPVNEFEERQIQNQSEPEPKVEIELAPAAESAENTADFDGITVKQIKQELDAFGVKYSPTAKKQELYDLMMQQGE